MPSKIGNIDFMKNALSIGFKIIARNTTTRMDQVISAKQTNRGCIIMVSSLSNRRDLSESVTFAPGVAIQTDFNGNHSLI